MEAEFKPILCMICLGVKSNVDCTVIDESIKNALYTLLLKLPVEEAEASKSMICSACYAKVFEAFRFKNACRATEESVIRYINSKDGAPVDLKEIYLKERGQEHLQATLKYARICRLCMQVVTYEFKFLRDIEKNLLRTYILDVNFNSTADPVVCTGCLESLKTHSSFLRTCLGVQNFENVYKKEETQSQFHVTSEEVQIKSEESHRDTETPLSTHQLADGKSQDYHYHTLKTKPSEPPIYQYNLSNSVFNSPVVFIQHQIASCENQAEMQLIYQIPIYRCHICNSQFDSLVIFMQHQLAGCYKQGETLLTYEIDKHKEQQEDKCSEVQIYKCYACSYETKTKYQLKCHERRHKSASEVEIYKCDKCDFETRQKPYLVSHMKKHKDISQVKTYKCDKCTFESKYWSSFYYHRLKYKDPSEIQMFKCDKCSYESNRKGSLVLHQLKHKDASEEQTYKCDKCQYKTNRKVNFNEHQLVHKDTSEVRMYKCGECSFESKHRKSLKYHRLLHLDVSEMKMYECDKCSYKSKRKHDLDLHQLRHKDITEVRKYVCDVCGYQTKRPSYLAFHQLKHKDPEELRKYKCDLCSFATKMKPYLKRHKLRHK